MASCVRNISTKNYQNLVTGFQVTIENVVGVFWDTVYTRNYMCDWEWFCDTVKRLGWWLQEWSD